MPAIHREDAFAKLTTELRVLGRRRDGYHLLDAEMVSLDLSDEITIEDGDALRVIDDVHYVGDGARIVPLDVPTDGANLVAKALTRVGRTASVTLRKRIPPGAGLGGGSSDAAAILRWAGSADRAVAAEIGADVPFCLRGGRARVGGVGDEIEALAFEPRRFVLLTPAFAVSTAAVYRAFDELGFSDDATSSNDLERAAINVEPKLAELMTNFSKVTALRPQLAGSGSTIFVESPDDGTALVDALEEMLRSTNTAGLVTLANATQQVEVVERPRA